MSRHHCRNFLQTNGSRRDMLQKSAIGFGATALAALCGTEQMCGTANADIGSDPFASKKTHFEAKARSVIFLYMDGGVSQVDSFDPKPELDKQNGKPFPTKTEPTQFNNIGNTLASPWKFKQYGQCGTPVSDLFPNIAEHVDDMAVVRSLVGNDFGYSVANARPFAPTAPDGEELAFVPLTGGLKPVRMGILSTAGGKSSLTVKTFVSLCEKMIDPTMQAQISINAKE